MRYSILAFAAVFALASFAKSPKRGLSENQFSVGGQLEVLEPGVTWYYNWGNTPSKGLNNQVINFEGMEYVPMCWNSNYNADAIREYCSTHPQTKYLLGFNEPNFTAQANMTPQKAAEAWPAVKALADELGLKLVAPALNYSPNAPYQDPLKWMDEFVALVGLDAFDYTAVHNYGGLGVMKTIAGNFHERYGKDVWVTEFCYWPDEGNPNSYVSPENQVSSMTETLYWLETTPWIFRYAWFKAYGNSDAAKGPNYGLLVRDGSDWYLSEQGKVYVGLSDFDTEKWHPVATTVPAVDFADMNMISVGSTQDADCGSLIEISRLNGGAHVTWQFDVKEAGKYIISTSVTGMGQPSRFDPYLQWVLVEGEKETPLCDTFTATLPNNETDYKTLTNAINLPSGHIKLRLKDSMPYSPSGIRISSLRLDSEAGVGEIIIDGATLSGDVYNIQGMRVGNFESDWERLPKGIYVVGGKKIIR